MSGVEYTGGNSGWCEVSVCLNSTVSCASPRAPIGIGFAMLYSFSFLTAGQGLEKANDSGNIRRNHWLDFRANAATL
jgi:hypothetical protein